MKAKSKHNSSFKFMDSNNFTKRERRFYDEAFFLETLSLERKRAERSGRPFLLMLIDVNDIIQKEDSEKQLRNIKSQIHDSTRETDIKGWYTDQAVIGVILTEIGENNNKKLIIEKIEDRLNNHLYYTLKSEYLDKLKISFNWYPEEYDQLGNSTTANILFYPDLSDYSKHSRLSLFFKRIIDISGSLFALILFLPLFIAIPALIKLTSKGPVLFQQERVGLFGEKFTFLKFRSMYVNNDSTIHQEFVKDLIANQDNEKSGDNQGKEDEVYKIQNDPRITGIGSFLRKTSLDELPQFINVLRGDMSLVGPRPPIPYELETYKVWHRRRVIEMKPGITGLWQIMGRSSCSFNEMVRLDLKYIKEWSLWLDIKIILQTPWVVIIGKGGY